MLFVLSGWGMSGWKRSRLRLMPLTFEQSTSNDNSEFWFCYNLLKSLNFGFFSTMGKKQPLGCLESRLNIYLPVNGSIQSKCQKYCFPCKIKNELSYHRIYKILTKVFKILKLHFNFLSYIFLDFFIIVHHLCSILQAWITFSNL